ncbi:uncharacterized protein LOC144105674 isoform X7 [Amblyomma americanum]
MMVVKKQTQGSKKRGLIRCDSDIARNWRTRCTEKREQRHYLECEQTNILCSSCKGNVKGRGWVQHTMSCEQHVLQCRYCAVAVPRHRLEEHERVCNENPGAIWEVVQEFVEPGNTEKQLKIVSQIKSKHAAHENKSQQVKATDGSKPAVINTDNEDHIMKCQFCERRVKKKNVCKHEELCQKKSKPLPTNSTTASMNEAPELMARGTTNEPRLGRRVSQQLPVMDRSSFLFCRHNISPLTM